MHFPQGSTRNQRTMNLTRNNFLKHTRQNIVHPPLCLCLVTEALRKRFVPSNRFLIALHLHLSTQVPARVIQTMCVFPTQMVHTSRGPKEALYHGKAHDLSGCFGRVTYEVPQPVLDVSCRRRIECTRAWRDQLCLDDPSH